MSIQLIGILVAAVLGTSFVSGIFGMAGGLILMGILLGAMPLSAAMALHAVTQMASNGWRTVLWWRYVKLSVLTGTVIGNLIALGIFMLIEWIPSKGTAYIVLGIVPFLVELLPERLFPNIMRPGMPVLCGVVIQALQLTCGVAGPTLSVFYQRSGLDRREIVATKAATQFSGHFIKLAYFTTLIAHVSAASIPLSVYGVSVLMAVMGTSLARRVLEAMNDTQFLVWSQRVIMSVGAFYLGWGVWLTAMG